MKYYQSRSLPTNATYGSQYWTAATDPDGKVRDLTREREQKIEDMREELEFIRGLQPMSVLDIGSGLGTSTRWLWENTRAVVVGVEPDQAARDLARTYTVDLHEKRRVDDRDGSGTTVDIDHPLFVADMSESCGFYDAALCYHVIEHMADPEAEMRKVHRALKPGGWLVIGTPDFGSAIAQEYGDRFRLLHDKTHISLFSSWSLCLMLHDIGFEVVDIKYPFFGTRHHHVTNLTKLADTSSGVSPPAPGNVCTAYCRKPG